MSPKSNHQRRSLRADKRSSQSGRGGGQRRANGRSAGKTGRKAARNDRKPRGTGAWRRFIRWGLLCLLAGPSLVVLLYTVVPPPVTPLMLIRAWEGAEIDYRWRPLDDISPHLARAVIASEDNRFCEHWGFDFEAFMTVFEDWRDGDRPRGASTITMQTAKNILLWPQRHILRKLLEAWLTPQLELLWRKRRILEVYLNIVELGPGIYGAEAAAQRYFGKPAAALNPREAALLAAALPSPLSATPDRPSAFLEGRVPVIRQRVEQLGPMLACAS